MLDVIIGRQTRNCQIRKHIHTKIQAHTPKKKSRKSWKKKGEGGKKSNRGGSGTKETLKKRKGTGQKENEGKRKRRGTREEKWGGGK